MNSLLDCWLSWKELLSHCTRSEIVVAVSGCIVHCINQLNEDSLSQQTVKRYPGDSVATVFFPCVCGSGLMVFVVFPPCLCQAFDKQEGGGLCKGCRPMATRETGRSCTDGDGGGLLLQMLPSNDCTGNCYISHY